MHSPRRPRFDDKLIPLFRIKKPQYSTYSTNLQLGFTTNKDMIGWAIRGHIFFLKQWKGFGKLPRFLHLHFLSVHPYLHYSIGAKAPHFSPQKNESKRIPIMFIHAGHEVLHEVLHVKGGLAHRAGGVGGWGARLLATGSWEQQPLSHRSSNSHHTCLLCALWFSFHRMTYWALVISVMISIN